MKKLLISLSLVFLCLPALSQSFMVRITPEAGFDAIDTIVNEFEQNLEQSILTVLNNNQPMEIDYYILNRPTGNLLELMIQNPNWSAAQLARMLVITFAYPVDVTAVMTNFENHPDIEVVFFDFALDPFDLYPIEPVADDQIILELAYLPSSNCQTSATNDQNLTYHVSINDQIINLDIVVSPPAPPSTTICGLPTNPSLTPYNLGQLAQGVYTININHVSADQNFPVNDDQRILVGNLPLVVRGTGAVQVPVNNWMALLILATVLLIASFAFINKK